MIAAGRLDRTISIERSTLSVDPAGTETLSWSVVATLRAELVRDAQDEQTSTPANTRATVSFRTRFAEVRLTDRLVFGGAVFNLKSVVEIGRRRGLTIVAERAGQ